MGVGNRGFVQGGCELQNCYTTTSRNKLRGADAVVFHGEDLGNAKTIDELKILKKFRHARRKEGEKVPFFVYFMKEPPHQVDYLQKCHKQTEETIEHTDTIERRMDRQTQWTNKQTDAQTDR